MYDLIIKNAIVLTSTSKKYSDIAVENGKIKKIVKRGALDKYQAKNTEVYDASGLVLMPGLIEPHMHIKAPLGGITDVLDFDSASKVAAYGGVTTFLDFSSTLPGMNLIDAVHDRKQEMSISKQDYSLHCKVVNFDNVDNKLDEIERVIKDEGVPTFKLFLTYKKAKVMIDDEYILKVLEIAKKYNARVGFHAESNVIAEYNEEKFEKEGKLSYEYFPECKGNICEEEAVSRILYYAELVKAPIFFFHISSKGSIKLIEEAKEKGVDVIAETCSHYLFFDKSKNKGEDGILYLMSPPLRTKEDQKALWKALKKGTLSQVTSDNCTFTRKQKEQSLTNGEKNFKKVISGVSGLEERFTLMRNAIENKKITEKEFVKLVSENPAKIFGLYPKKGAIRIGSDADFTLFDPNKLSTLKKEDLHYPKEVEYSIYEEFSAKGKVVTTIRRGEFLLKDGVYNEGAYNGSFSLAS